MTLPVVVRIDLLQRTLKTIFEAELGIPFIWGKSNNPRRPRPFGRLDLISGPAQLQSVEHDRTTVSVPSSVLVNVPAAPVEGTVWLARVNGVPLRHTSPAGETQTSLRDALIALVNSDREPATAASTTAGQFRVSESVEGGLYNLHVAPSLAGFATGPNVLEVVEDPGASVHLGELVHAVSEATLLLEIVGADNRVGTDGSAGDIMGKVPMALNLRRTQQALEDQRLVVDPISTPADIGNLEGGGAQFESRYNIDLLAKMTSMYVEVTDTIESVEGTIRIGGTDVPIEVAS